MLFFLFRAGPSFMSPKVIEFSLYKAALNVAL